MGVAYSLRLLFFIVCSLAFGVGSYAGDINGAVLLSGDEKVEETARTYITRKHMHPHGDKSAKATGSSPYKAAYAYSDKKKRSENSDAFEDPYLTGYGDRKEDNLNKAYLIQYGDHRSERDEQEEDGENHSSRKSSYLTGYHGEERENDLIGAWVMNRHRPHRDEEKESGSNHHWKRSYLTGYRNEAKGSDLNKAYLIQYGDEEKKKKTGSNQHPRNSAYLTRYREEEKGGDLNKPYLIRYGDGNRKHSGKQTEESYLTGYRSDAKKDQRKASVFQNGDQPDRSEAFKNGFFTLDDLYVGNKMGLMFPVENFSNFLPRKIADSIPFSSSQLPSVLQLFSLSPDSTEAEGMQDVHSQCEAPPLTGETKVCVSSIEAMVEFVHSILGSSSRFELLTTSFPTMPSTSSLQSFTIAKISPDFDRAPEWVACHPMPYPYAVYFCHFISTGTKIFKTSLAGENGETMEALGICHLDTSEWTAGHVVFKQLGIKPGEAPICHFFPVKHLLWVPVPTKAAN